MAPTRWIVSAIPPAQVVGGVPTGGLTGQVLRKNSDTTGDFSWQTHPAALTAWTALPFQPNWGNYGAPHALGTYRKNADGLVTVRGLVRKTVAATSGEYVAIMPAGFRPTANNGYALACCNAAGNNSTVIRVDLDASGFIVLNYDSSLANPGTWVFMNMHYYID